MVGYEREKSIIIDLKNKKIYFSYKLSINRKTSLLNRLVKGLSDSTVPYLAILPCNLIQNFKQQRANLFTSYEKIVFNL